MSGYARPGIRTGPLQLNTYAVCSVCLLYTSITRETTFESIGIDSLDTVDLVIDLEEAFHIIIERDETIETVGELVDIIDELSCQEG